MSYVQQGARYNRPIGQLIVSRLILEDVRRMVVWPKRASASKETNSVGDARLLPEGGRYTLAYDPKVFTSVKLVHTVRGRKLDHARLQLLGQARFSRTGRCFDKA